MTTPSLALKQRRRLRFWVFGVAAIWVILFFEARRIPVAEKLGELIPLWVAALVVSVAFLSGLVLFHQHRFSLSVVMCALGIFFVSSISFGIILERFLGVFLPLVALLALLRFIHSLSLRLKVKAGES